MIQGKWLMFVFVSRSGRPVPDPLGHCLCQDWLGWTCHGGNSVNRYKEVAKVKNIFISSFMLTGKEKTVFADCVFYIHLCTDTKKIFLSGDVTKLMIIIPKL